MGVSPEAQGTSLVRVPEGSIGAEMVRSEVVALGNRTSLLRRAHCGLLQLILSSGKFCYSKTKKESAKNYGIKL